MKKTGDLILFLVVCVVLPNLGYGQIDGNVPDASYKSAVALYEKKIGNQSHLYNGTNFKSFPISDEEHPFFLSPDFASGSINCQGQSYSNVYLQYNIVTDQLLIEDGQTKNTIQLINANIQSFTLNGHLFEKISNASKVGLTDGFYGVENNGPTRMLVRYEKSLQHKVSGGTPVPWYDSKTKIYIWAKNQYVSVNSRKSLLNLLADKKDEVKKILSERKVAFSRSRIAYCRIAVRGYDSLNAR